MSDTSQFSLLWPDGSIPEAALSGNLAQTYTDLNVSRLVQAMALNARYEAYAKQILMALTTDGDTIRYRQDIIRDLLDHPALITKLEIILEEIITLERYLTAPQWKENVLRQVAWRLSELQRYVEIVETLHDVLSGAELTSNGLQSLRTYLAGTIASSLFQQLQRELPNMLVRIRDIRSITIGINLDLELRPISATLLEARTEPFEGDSMLARLLGIGRADEAVSVENPIHDARFISGIRKEQIELNDRNSPFMPQLFRDLSELMDETSRPVVKSLKQYTQVRSQFLIALKMEIAFYIGAVRLIKRLQDAGHPVTQPDIQAAADRISHFTGLYNINLCLQHLSKNGKVNTTIIRNDARFDEAGRILILTGPNQGGKTTYTQAVGLAQIMAQAGLHVPAEGATICPVDGIYTHFATEERPNLEAGRLGEEARRLNQIFHQATSHSLVLLNESLASTSASESLYLARDVVRALRLLGVRAIFATHLHDLAAECDTLNAQTDGDSRIISIVSQVMMEADGATVRRTYRIEPGPPMSKSYAIELAARFGISFDQLRDTLQQRDLL